MTYKLCYFPVEAKGELIRFIFAQAGVEYEDVRIKEDWPKIKPTTPFGHVPTLEVNGDVLAGSGPIARFLAERHGLAGSNDIENAKIAGIKDFQNEVLLKMVMEFFEKDPATKDKLKKQVVDEIPKCLGIMEKTIKDGWLFGSKLTYVDLHLFLIVDFMKLYKEDDLLEGFPGVKNLYDAVGKLPNIAKWIKNRPERTFGPPVA